MSFRFYILEKMWHKCLIKCIYYLFILAAFINAISCSLELQSSHGSRKLHYSSFIKCESCFLIICMCSILQSFLLSQGKKLQLSSSHLNCHPILSLIIIPSSGSAIIIISLELSSHHMIHITHHHTIFWISQ